MILSAHTYIRNAVAFDYPFREVCRSAMGIADELVILYEHTQDGTDRWIEDLQEEFPDRVRVFQKTWWLPDRNQECLADAINYCIERCRGDYHLHLDADECLHEDQARILRRIAEDGHFDHAVAGKLHFWGGYERVVVSQSHPVEAFWFGKRSLFPHLRAWNDGFALGYPDGSGNQRRGAYLWAHVQFFHYGFVRRPIGLIEKQAAMQDDLYKFGRDQFLESARETESLDWFGRLPIEETVAFTGTHPAAIQSWIAERRRCFAP